MSVTVSRFLLMAINSFFFVIFTKGCIVTFKEKHYVIFGLSLIGAIQHGVNIAILTILSWFL